MSTFKCKMCGGEIEFEQGATVGVCDSCGTKQTLPRLDDDRKANLYDRANHFRRNNDFDKAMGIYEQILNEDGTDAETYWSLVLCRYGIEYVEDPDTHKRIPTVNRAQYTSIFMDEDYKSAIKYADGYQREIYEQEAKAIDEIQKGILEISRKEEPFDCFISFKETDANGRRTRDAVLAQDLYNELTKEGFKVFFAPVTLEDKLGTAYEPYIFAALNSSKVMVILGTKPENFNAVWVKNEWSRYLALIKNGAKKTLIPAYRDMDPYDLPEEFSHLMAQDMSKLGFMQDLIRGIKKLLAADEPKAAVKETVVVNGGGAAVEPLLKRAQMFLEDENWEEADKYCEKVLDQEPENAQAYLYKLMAECKVCRKEQLKDCRKPFDGSSNFKKVVRFGDASLKEKLEGDIRFIKERNEKIGKTIIFGTYPYVKGGQTAPIEWSVLDVQGNKVLVISKYALDCQQYNTSCIEVTWETCTLRTWLNGTFLDSAFSSSEQAAIAQTTVTADKNPKHDTDPGNATMDKVFLLSIDEANKYFSSDSARACLPTDYAVANGAFENDSNGNCWWWLRSPGEDDQIGAVSVDDVGAVDYYGDFVDRDDGAVRPAMWINLDPKGSAKGSENIRLNKTYYRALAAMKCADTEEDYKAAAEEFKKISGVKDADKLAAQCLEKSKELKARCEKDIDKALKHAVLLSLEEIESDESLQALQQKIEKLKNLALQFPAIVSESRDLQARKNTIEQELSNLRNARAKLGIFAGKEKKATDEKIVNKEAELKTHISKMADCQSKLCGYSSIEQVNKQIEELKNTVAERKAITEKFKDIPSYESAWKRLGELCKSSEVYTEVVKKISSVAVLFFMSKELGEPFTFGSYPYTRDGQMAPIIWEILDVQAGKMLVISKYALDFRQYNINNTGVTWKTCTLRTWLNGTFLNSAFSEKEQAAIAQTTVTADKNPEYDTYPGSATTDKVFLLSIDEANKYFSSDSARQCELTAYAAAKVAYKSDSGFCWWWLRSPGLDQLGAAYVFLDGSVGCCGSDVDNGRGAVRPALWIDLEA